MHRNMRVVAAALLITAIGAACLWAQGKPDDPFGPSPPDGQKSPRATPTHKVVKLPAKQRLPARRSPTEAEQRIERALAGKTKMQFNENTLGEVVEYLKDRHAINIWLDKKALEEFDLGSDTSVTFAVNGISLRSALELMLRDFDLTYTIRDEVLLITTQEAEEEYRTMRVYDVVDLVTYRDEKGEPYTDYDPLVHTLTTSIEPDSWQQAGGNGTIVGEDFNTAKILVVTQTYHIHRRIGELLAAIRMVTDGTPGDGRPPLRPRPKNRGLHGMGGMGGGMGGMGGGMGGMGGGRGGMGGMGGGMW